MRIALVNNFFPPRASGSAHLTEELARHLTARGHEILVVTSSFEEAPAQEARDGYRIVRMPSHAIPKSKLTMRFDVTYTATPRNVRRLFRMLDDFRPDLVHQHGQFFDLTFQTSVYARRRAVPVVLSVHTRLEHPSTPHALALWLGDLTLVRSFIAISRPHVVVMDRLMQTYVTRRFGIPPDRQVAIPVGIDPSRFASADGRAVRTRLGLGDRPIVMSIGHVIPLRDRLGLIEAMPQLLEKHPDLAVVVVGKVYDGRFLERAEELNVLDHIVLTGAVAKDDVPELLAAADVETHELQGLGLGTATLEVMAAGVPVVAVVRADNFVGIELRSWQDLVLSPPDDPRALAERIVRLIDDEDLAASVAEGQRRLVEEHFTLERVTDRHVELYERLTRAAGS